MVKFCQTNSGVGDESISRIGRIIDDEYAIDIPLSVLRELLKRIEKEVNDPEQFRVHNDESFILKSFAFAGFEEELNQAKEDAKLIQRVYNDFCSIYTGMTSSYETGKVLISNEKVRTGCRIIYGENGFIIIDGTSGKLIAKGENLEENQWQREIVLDWDEPICEEWVLYAEKYGWEKPCRMRVNVNLYDDIVDY